MFIDLAGNKRYLKTTLFGLTSQVPDYSLIAIDAGQRVSETTTEHIKVIFALQIPAFITLTKVDKYSQEEIQSTIDAVRFYAL